MSSCVTIEEHFTQMEKTMTETEMMENELAARTYPEPSLEQTVSEMGSSGVPSNREALSAEQQEPEKYADLVVRFAGYSS